MGYEGRFTEVVPCGRFAPTNNQVADIRQVCDCPSARQSGHLVGVGFLYFVTIGGAPGSGGDALTAAKAGAGAG